jgi:hypothetical protein
MEVRGKEGEEDGEGERGSEGRKENKRREEREKLCSNDVNAGRSEYFCPLTASLTIVVLSV